MQISKAAVELASLRRRYQEADSRRWRKLVDSYPDASNALVERPNDADEVGIALLTITLIGLIESIGLHGVGGVLRRGLHGTDAIF